MILMLLVCASSATLSGCIDPNEPERIQMTWPVESNLYKAPEWTPAGNLIVFQHRDTIYTVNKEGTKLKRITSGDENDYELHQSPEISPDGTRIVYSTTRHKVSKDSKWVRNFDIEVMDIDGSNQKRLTNSRYWDLDPIWSQDGQKVFFVRLSRNDDAVIGTFAVNADGTDEQHLTWIAHHLRPQVQHNGRSALVLSEKSLVYAKTGVRRPVEYEVKKETTFVEKGETFLATAELDLSNLIEHKRFPDVSFPNAEHPPFQSTPMEKIAGGTTWSPDGEKLAYILVNYEQKDAEKLIAHEKDSRNPAPEGRWTLNTLNLADSQEASIELTDTNCTGRMEWSPNGKYILITSHTVCMANLEAGTVSHFGRTSGESWPTRWLNRESPRASWSPKGNRIAIKNRCTGDGRAHYCLVQGERDDILMFTIHPDGTEFLPIVQVDRGSGKLKPRQD